MDEDSRLTLKKMINEYNTEETTDKIRNLKHSSKIKTDVMHMLKLKKTHSRVKMETLKNMCMTQCAFLHKNYTNIFNKLFKGDLDITILMNFVDILKQIEDGNLDQHEGSVKVGEILKSLYIDSVLKEEKRKETSEKRKKTKKSKVKNVSWNDYKMLNGN
tara:strand:+ start:246 stop:725 length:480 start_codon:yes stop_codon:yes gene_type:complete